MDGTLVTGEGVAATFVAGAADALAAGAGFRPYPGTVNLSGVDGAESLPRLTIDDDLGDPHCEGVELRPCAAGGVRCAVIRPLVPGYPADKLELLAPVRLRDLFGLETGDALALAPPDDPWSTPGPRADPDALGAFDAVVFDLDGTLVDLTVDWGRVHAAIEDRFGDLLDRPVTAHRQNELFAVASAHDRFDELAELIGSFERRGALEATPLPALDVLSGLDVPVGVCTLNARRAAELALERFDARDDVDAIVARETVRPGKPDPGPLLECLDRLGVDPGNALFVGDQPGDAETAARAAASVLDVAQLWPST